ncbi:MAG: flagellar biosynthesis protein FlhA [Comamonadaceae bacterium]|uniref:Flagellar biosynthesis protein FlhA n=2 Tax=Comamonas kerstersii TaxID=225992 RepID=A0A6A1R0I0_9BURK|nr:flagellar biosynthesis protein FlhA [Comamonas kerstersii]KAB0585728.1 flagellar biosynthesis protein FlhA [Comamonas kerstersii]MDO4968052.1 flagellar biosynthesis protein FlhA [Comamonadaceae bacterium]HBW63019.1 flagellar biosynthesis protein FlhA [Comamonas kerstersii]
MSTALLKNLQNWNSKHGMGIQNLAAPMLVIAILALMVLPMPPWLLDTFFTLNIATALMVMMIAAYMVKPLDFAAFPSVLLLTTLMRLSLNVASTRVVLLEGHTGPGAAGQVIESFGHFLIGGNFAVGLIVFAILVVINFVVITKGAERIAEVSARFTLDAMPGKQMAVDADLNAGLIDEAEAKRRRAEVQEEANFFGSMDGASKFVRGDAMAGILILIITIVGGFIIGMAQHGMSAGDAANSYILLSVGDALVAQIPALLISVASAMVISRVGKDNDTGKQIANQMLSSPRALAITSAILIMLGLIPNMPHTVFLTIGALFGYGAWTVYRKGQKKEMAAKAGNGSEAPAANPGALPAPQQDSEATWDDLQPVDLLGLELGYRLIALVDKKRQGDLLTRIKGVRRKFAQEVGFLPPAVHVRDNLELKPSAYRITLRGVMVGEGEAFPGMYLAINPGGITTPLIGTPTTDPAFGLPAHWIDERQKEAAQMAGFTVVDSETVMATHLSHLMQMHAAKLLSRNEVQQLVDHVAKSAPKLIEEVIPKMVSITVFQKVLQLLLEDAVHIRDIRTIIETLAENAASTQDPAELARRVRIALAPAIVQQIYGPTRELNVIAIEPGLERLLMQALSNPQAPSLDPGVADVLTQRAAEVANKQEELGMPACLLVPDAIRNPIARLVRRAAPRLQVLAHSEIPETHTIRIGPILKGANA